MAVESEMFNLGYKHHDMIYGRPVLVDVGWNENDQNSIVHEIEISH